MSLENLPKYCADSCVRLSCFAATLQKNGVSGADGERGNLWARIGTRFVNDRKDADRCLDLAKDQSVVQLCFFKYTSHGILHLRDLLDSGNHFM